MVVGIEAAISKKLVKRREWPRFQEETFKPGSGLIRLSGGPISGPTVKPDESGWLK
jgi:hypothetical protein